jgi:hypothetical protein
MPDATLADVARLSYQDRLKRVIEKTIDKLPSGVGEQLRTLLDVRALAVATGIVIVWAGLHFVGIGEVADVILLVTAFATLGAVAWQAGKELVAFAVDVKTATTDADLDDAAAHLAKAVSMIGVQAVLMLLLHTAPKPFAPKMRPGWWNFGAAPRSPGGKWFYEPKVAIVPPPVLGRGAVGETSVWGDVKISSALSRADRQATLFHELVHQFLTPRLYVLRELRVQIAIQGYERSVILRYLEEAMAETYTQLRTRGFNMNALIEGITFPVQAGYDITLASVAKEATGVLLGPINVGGMVWNVWLAPRWP